jgi:hypothetical protein
MVRAMRRLAGYVAIFKAFNINPRSPCNHPSLQMARSRQLYAPSSCYRRLELHYGRLDALDAATFKFEGDPYIATSIDGKGAILRTRIAVPTEK